MRPLWIGLPETNISDMFPSMSAKILDGKTLAANIRSKVKARVAALPQKPGLAVILVGADPASHTYVALKQKACEEVGISFEKHLFFATEPEEKVIAKIHELNARPDITGILVQLPLPSQNPDRVISAIDPQKDVDGFHPENVRRLREGKPAIAPAVALGIMKLIDASEESLSGKRAVVIGSDLFAEPLRTLLNEHGVSTETVSHQDPERIAKTKTADIVIVAVGQPNLITAPSIKPGAIVIDVGTTKVEDKIVGDMDRSSVEPVAGFLTPVPGGVGRMTVAMLMLNVLKAHELQKY